MKLGQSIEVQLVDMKGEPLRLSNVAISIQFLVQGRFRYQFPLGLTDSEGRLVASYADLEESRRKNAEFFLMDYNTKLEDTDPSVRILLESDSELRRRHDYAKRIFESPSPWGENWPSNAQLKPQEKLVALSEGTTIIRLQTQSVP